MGAGWYLLAQRLHGGGHRALVQVPGDRWPTAHRALDIHANHHPVPNHSRYGDGGDAHTDDGALPNLRASSADGADRNGCVAHGDVDSLPNAQAPGNLRRCGNTDRVRDGHAHRDTRADGNADRIGDGGANGDGREHRNADGLAHGGAIGDARDDRHADRVSYARAKPNAHGDTHANRCTLPGARLDGDALADSNPDGGAHADVRSGGNALADGNPDGDALADSKLDGDALTDSKLDGDAPADTRAHGDADGNPYPYPFLDVWGLQPPWPRNKVRLPAPVDTIVGWGTDLDPPPRLMLSTLRRGQTVPVCRPCSRSGSSSVWV